MPTDKKITELPVASSINAADVSVLVDAGTDYQYSFTQLLQFLEAYLLVGAIVTFGTVLPQNTTGNNGDVFINTAAGSFAQKVAGTWTVVYTLPAANAADGTMLYGAGTPSSALGKNSDSYINTLTGIFYLKSAGAWSQVFSMATGPQGPQGTAGTNGANGANGNTILYGTTVPSNSTTGVNGDFYLNTATFTLYGPKAGGVWPAGTSLVGATGPAGASTWGGITGTLSAQTDLNAALTAKAPLASPALTGTPTAPTQPGGDSSTKIATTAYVDKNFISELGIIYNKSSWTDLSDWTVNGATVSVVSNALQFSGGAGTFTQTLDMTTGPHAYSCLEKWKVTMQMAMTAINGTSYGGGISFRITNAFGSNYSVYSQLELETGGGIGRLNILYPGTGGALASSVTNMPVTAGDVLEISLERSGTLIILSGRNITQNSATISCEYVYSLAYGTTIDVPNTGHFGICSFGGTFNVISYRIYSSEIKNADLLFLGDSKTIGFYSDTIDQRFSSLFAANFNSNSVVLAGGNNTTADVLNYLNQVIALRPKSVLFCAIGRNDIFYGVATATWQANIVTIRNTCIANGISFYFLLPMAEGNPFSTGLNQSALKSYFLSIDSSKCIDPALETQTASVVLAADDVHLSPAGEQWVETQIQNSGFFTTNSGSVNISNIPTFIGQTTLVAGTISISLAGITANSRAFYARVIPSGVSSTVEYDIVCDTNTLTITAKVAAGTINTSDISTVNYQVYK